MSGGYVCPLDADIFLSHQHISYEFFSAKRESGAPDSLFLSDDQLRGPIDTGIVSKLRKDDVRLLCRHRR